MLVYCGDGSVDLPERYGESADGISSETRQVQAVATSLTRAGLNVATYTHKTSPRERKQRLKRFSEGEIQAKDKISFAGLDSITPGKPVTMTVKHEDGSSDSVQVNHTLNDDQIKWFNAGSALNYVGSQK